MTIVDFKKELETKIVEKIEAKKIEPSLELAIISIAFDIMEREIEIAFEEGQGVGANSIQIS